jgi:toxin YoeB
MKPVELLEDSWDEYQRLTEQDKKTRHKINQLLQSIGRDGEEKGIGQPEPLSGDKASLWSRHIDKKNRLVYRVEEEGCIKLYEVGSHYGDK